MSEQESEGTRLNKHLAHCGVGSRRACDQFIQEGRVEINGSPCMNPATRVAPDDFVRFDGRRVSSKETLTIILNKPRGYVCTKKDELDRETIYSLLPGSMVHLNHVGRLDKESEGLLVLSNDGRLSQQLLHPSHRIEKEYLVTADQPVTDEHLDQFLSGLHTEEGKLVAQEIERLSSRRLRLILVTGKKRQIRVMFRTLGYQVRRLVRVRIGAFSDPNLPPGKSRRLFPDEVENLLQNPNPRKARKGHRSPTRDQSGRPRKSAKSAKSKRAAPPRADQPRARKSTGRRPPPRHGKGASRRKF